MKPHVPNSPLKISDRGMFLFLYPCIALSVVHIGNDNSVEKLLSIPSYYTDLMLSFFCTYSIGLYLKKLFQNLSIQFDWKSEFNKTLLMCLFLGILLPTVLAIGMELIYLHLINKPLDESPIFYLELPLVLIFTTLINLIYLFMYTIEFSKLLEEPKIKHDPKKECETKPETIICTLGKKNEIVAVQDVAYFIVENKSTYVVTLNNRRLFFDYSLSEIMDIVSNDSFFQLNRQVIAHKNSVQKFTKTETRRLKIDLYPSTETEIYIPKTKITEFQDWLLKANRSDLV